MERTEGFEEWNNGKTEGTEGPEDWKYENVERWEERVPRYGCHGCYVSLLSGPTVSSREWNAIKSGVDPLNLRLTDEQVKEVTAKIKKLGDIRLQNIDDVDSIIRDFHADVNIPAFGTEIVGSPLSIEGRPAKKPKLY